MSKKYLSIADLAKEFGIHEMTFYRLIASKKLKAIKVGAQWRVEREELDKFLEDNKSKSNE